MIEVRITKSIKIENEIPKRIEKMSYSIHCRQTVLLKGNPNKKERAQGFPHQMKNW